MIVSYAALSVNEQTRAIESREGFSYEETFVGFPWKNMSATSRFVMVFNPRRAENMLINYSFQKLSEPGLNFWTAEEAINDKEMLKAASKDEAYAFLLSPKEDIYSLEDGSPFKDEE